MIHAQAKQHNDHLSLVIIYPDKTPSYTHTITGGDLVQMKSRAMSIIHFLNRDYILKKMSSWLKQRIHALEETKQPYIAKEAAQLLVILNYNQDRGFYRICQLVCDNEGVIKLVAPGAKSKHFNYYSNRILAILKFCKEMV